MKYLSRAFLLVCLSLSFTQAHADAAQQLSQLLNTTQSMQANFTESLIDKRGGVMSKSQGKMALQRPGKFRWDVKSPNPQLIVTNGKKVWIYDQDLEQVSIHKLTRDQGEAPALLLSRSDTALMNKFQVKTLNDGGLAWFLLMPKNSNDALAAVKLGFANNQVQQMELLDHLGNRTRIQFSHIETNINLAQSLFSFTPPRNVDVLDETKH